MRLLLLVLALVSALTVSCRAPATLIDVANPGFDLPAASPSAIYITSADNWTLTGSSGRVQFWEGIYAAYSNVHFDGLTNGLTQTLGAAFEEGEYYLTVKAGGQSPGLTSRLSMGFMEGAALTELDHKDVTPGLLGFGNKTVKGWVSQTLIVAIGPGSPAIGKLIWIGLKGTTASSNTDYFYQLNLWDDVTLTRR